MAASSESREEMRAKVCDSPKVDDGACEWPATTHVKRRERGERFALTADAPVDRENRVLLILYSTAVVGHSLLSSLFTLYSSQL